MGMAILELGHILFTFLGVLTLTLLVDGQNQLGFISLDCGISTNSTYKDANTTLDYVSDASFINAGEGKAVAPGYSPSSLARQLWYVRTFPTGERNCYNIPVTINTQYLIRTTFYYGNYDRLNMQPTFDLHLGVNKWVTVEIDDVTNTLTKEIIYRATMNYIYVCLVNTGNGTPFLNALELRPLPNDTYNVPAGALALYSRLDRGSISSDIVRYPDDAYDRFWYPNHLHQCTDISTDLTIDAQAHNDYHPPSQVMRSASIPTNASQPLQFYIAPQDSTLQFYVFMHFAEIVKLGPNETRIFNISENDRTWYGPVTPYYLSTNTIYGGYHLTGETTYNFSLFKVDGSTLPPIQNAIEYYYLVNLDLLQTDQADVDAITNIKSTYGITRNWQGDPCAPQNYSWDGLNCSYPDGAQPIITAMNLSSSGLGGLISPDIGNLQSLESLDLSNNSFTGSVPSFLSKLTSLKVLNLSGNNLTGSVPVDLYQRSQNGLLQLSVSGNPNLCLSDPCTPTKVEKKKTRIVAPVVASIAGVLVLATALAIVFICLRRRNKSVSQSGNVDITSSRSHEQLDAKKRQFTYSELRQMTNNFNKVLGKGGSGIVYRGHLGGTPVAVKMLSESSVQGVKEFQAEVKLLLRVHHKNLTTLVGYCDESPNLGLIYEYMANGNLKDHLSEKNSKTFSLEGRLQVSVEAAQGLEYLHNGCKPPIVHRDVKTANILLNDKFQAKLADFGQSRVFPTEAGTHVSTIVAGTPGYLDPEYYLTNWLTEKSDVFSFGVVLLEIITGRFVIDKAQQYGHISQWVSSLVENGDINQVVDPRLHGELNINSVWKVVELALSCLSAPSARRPTMSQVVIELNEALAMEMARTREGFSSQSRQPIGTIQVDSTISPVAR